MSEMPSPDAFSRPSRLFISSVKSAAMGAAKLPNVASSVVSLPSFRTLEHVHSAATEALGGDQEAIKHKLPVGSSQLRATFAKSHHELTGRQVSAERIDVVTAGNMQSVKVTLDTILEPGDEFISTASGFASHINWSLNRDGKEPLQCSNVSDKPGSAFNSLGEGQVRMAFCVSERKIDEGSASVARHIAA